MPAIEQRVELGFIRQTLLGESVVPYRVFRPYEAVIPITPEGDGRLTLKGQLRAGLAAFTAG